MGSAFWHFYEHLVAFFVPVPYYSLALLGFIALFVFRIRGGGGSLYKRFDFEESVSEESHEESVCEGIEAGSEHSCEGFNDSIQFGDSENERDNEKSGLCFKFRFPTYDEFINRKEKGEFVDSEVRLTSSSCSKYEFMSREGFSSFTEEPEVLNINAEVSDSVILENENTVALHKHLEQSHCEADDVCSKEVESSDNGANGEGEKNQTQADFDLSDEVLFQSEKDSFVTDSDTVSIGFEHMHGLMSRLVDYYSDGFLSEGEFEFGDGEKLEEEQGIKVFDQVDTDVLGEDIDSSEQDHLDKLETLASEFLAGNDFQEDDEIMNGSLESKEEAVLDSGDVNKLESLWEHQDLIEQLKMELRKVRATGLPTILEESESSKMEELKPWKIDERFQHGDCMDELHTFYKSYRDRMRKFDIFTYQKMYAIGFLQKDPLELLSSHKCSRPTVKSLLPQNLWVLKHKSHGSDPMEKFMKELQSDLEVVYVGQMCLSWEFLYWQCGKALELLDSDPRGFHRYNEVAGEFQQFQVLMQRFIEDEPFQGTRVQHYIKRRCDSRNLLQVPVIREDSIKDRKKSRKLEKGDNAITIEMIVETLEESIRIFWQFLKSDKDSTTTTVKAQKGVHPNVQNTDLELLMEVMKNLRKKENMLKNILRSENYILKRSFRRSGEQDSDSVLYFFSQVDIKLVFRVLNMSRLTTDQLVWCHEKLSRISFVQRKIHVEPSFLLFPC